MRSVGLVLGFLCVVGCGSVTPQALTLSDSGADIGRDAERVPAEVGADDSARDAGTDATATVEVGGEVAPEVPSDTGPACTPGIILMTACPGHPHCGTCVWVGDTSGAHPFGRTTCDGDVCGDCSACP
jgi:hypothetical protein